MGIEYWGKFKVLMLCNVVVIVFYMYNGVFWEFKMVIEFYDYFFLNLDYVLNFEIGLVWCDLEVFFMVSICELVDGFKFSVVDIEGLVCFLCMLMDVWYEYLIENNGVDCRE